jgi:hypothetical protein
MHCIGYKALFGGASNHEVKTYTTINTKEHGCKILWKEKCRHVLKLANHESFFIDVTW